MWIEQNCSSEKTFYTHCFLVRFRCSNHYDASMNTTEFLPTTSALWTVPFGTSTVSPGWSTIVLPYIVNWNSPEIIASFFDTPWLWSGKVVPGVNVYWVQLYPSFCSLFIMFSAFSTPSFASSQCSIFGSDMFTNEDIWTRNKRLNAVELLSLAG